jgi:hypothetical protein
MNYSKEIIIRMIKLLDIGYITTIYAILAIILAKLFDKYFGNFDEVSEEKKSLIQSIIELILHLWLIGIVIYIVRNFVPLIPFPLNGIYGFNHLKVKELSTATVFSIVFIYFYQYYQNKVKFILSKIII